MTIPRVALVTGASRGIGRAVALRLAAAGCVVAVHYATGAEAAAATVADITASGGAAFAIAADLADENAVAAMFAQLDEHLDARGLAGLSVLVNNAGIAEPGRVADVADAALARMVAVNIRGTLLVCRHAIRRLRDGSRIISISSAAARSAMPSYAAYAMTKAAVEVLARNLAAELGPRGITSNAVAPGVTMTDMSAAIAQSPEIARRVADAAALRRLAEPDDVAAVVAWLASDDARWITGQVIEASGGARL